MDSHGQKDQISGPIGVLIVDDHTIVRQGLKMLLETETGITVVGEAENGLVAVQLARDLKPDIILMDLNMPVMDGITAIKEIRLLDQNAKIIILTTYNEDQKMLAGLSAGAKGYLLKDMTRGVLLQTINAAAQGLTLLGPEVLQRVLKVNGKTSDQGFQHSEQSGHVSKNPLSKREKEVLKAIATGHTNPSAAKELGISERTIKAHMTSIFNKLGVYTRGAAIATAAEKGWLDMN